MGDRRASFESYGEPDAPPAYASLSSPLVAQHGFQPAEQHILHPAFDHAFSQLNLPRGYFLLRNVAQGKTLDLLGHKQHEGAELGLHPIKQPQLQGLSLQHRQNNQLLFVDWDGHLVSAAASRAIEVEDSRLTLAFPHPITTYPSSLSHPIPRFRLDPVTSTLHVLFGYDPSFLGPDDSPDQQNDYIVEAVPLKRRPSEATVWSTPPILSGLGSRAAELGGRIGAFVGGRFSAPASPNPLPGLEKDELPPPPPPEKAPEKDVPPVPSTSTSELPDLPAKPSVKLAEGSTGQSFVEEEDSDSDTEPSAYRPVRVVRLESGWREKFPAEALRSAPDPSFGVTRWTSSSRELRMWRRRQWHVIPVTVQPVPAPDGFLVPSPSASEVFTRSRSSSSYFGASSSSGIDDSPGASDENDDTLSYDVPHRSSLARDDPLTQPPNVSHRWSASQALTAGSIAAASHLSGLISSRFVPSATRQLPLPPSPPLPRVPSDLAQPHVSKEDAFDPGSTPRPDDADEWADANVLRSGDISDLGHASGTASSVELVGGSAQASAQESPQESEQEETADVDEESVKTGDVLAKADIEKASVVQADERADSGGPQDEKVLSVREVKASERPEAAEDKQDLGPALVAGNASEGQTESV